jgi:hypothetical protein
VRNKLQVLASCNEVRATSNVITFQLYRIMTASLSKSLSSSRADLDCTWEIVLGCLGGPVAISFDVEKYGGCVCEILGDGMRLVLYDRRQHFLARNYGTGQTGVWQFHD